jgi:hypothetical protein
VYGTVEDMHNTHNTHIRHVKGGYDETEEEPAQSRVQVHHSNEMKFPDDEDDQFD